jgi:hypothetical protein
VPVPAAALSALGWRVKSNFERQIELENKLRDDRVDVYNKILEPFVIILMSEAAWSQDKKNRGKDKNDFAASNMLSLDYRRLGFKLSLTGSDGVVKAYNNLMQYFYNLEDLSAEEQKSFIKEMMELLGSFLLEIRKSMGNEATKLDNWAMCEWWMKDVKKLRSGDITGV